MGPQARMAAGNAPHPEAGVTADDVSGIGPFVINLCSSTTPMALAHPDSPELKRFSFFVSRRREDNRERFRLHMGYFTTLAEAEEWLNVVRDIYPGAWAGEAPGKKLRARAAAMAATTAAASDIALPPAKPAPQRRSAVCRRLRRKIVRLLTARPAPAPVQQARPVAAPAPARPAAAPQTASRIPV